jgi:hydroxymethylpyrimidine pyrophosphatase-like HAD family hydrolase
MQRDNDMSPLILTDLDDTLFQTLPKCPPGADGLRQMSSLLDGTASGFATKMQQNFLLWLEVGKVIPVTARGRDVLARVNIARSPAICSNGGCILDDEGILDLVWHRQLEEEARRAEPVADIYRMLTESLCTERFRHWSVEENGLDLYIVVKSNERDDLALERLETEFEPLLPTGWRCHRNGNNLAYLPPWLSKRHATRYVIERNRAERPDQPIIGIGDSVSDVGFMDLCDFAVAPTNSQLWAKIVDGSKWID